MATITLGGGCFWCIESAFNRLSGVSAQSGYMGGEAAQANYKTVCSGLSGHIEVVQVHYDVAHISLTEILSIFFELHDASQWQRQGNDIGPQYQSAIYYHSDPQLADITLAITTAQQQQAKTFTTIVKPALPFYPAEDYHQGYFDENPNQPYCQIVVAPKIIKLQQKYARFLKNSSEKR